MKYCFAKLAFAGMAGLILSSCASKQPAPVVDRTSQPAAAVVSVDAKPPVADRVAAKGFYVVKLGDTLYRISLDHGQGYKDVATWNNLESPYLIHPGQELRVQPPDVDGSAVVITKPVTLTSTVEQRSLDDSADGMKRLPKAGREAYSDEAYANAVKGTEGAIVRLEIKSAAPVEVKSEKKGDSELQWSWPAAGKPLGHFGESGKKGLELAGKKGDPILAAADGKVVYSGTALRGYGQLLIVKHSPVYLSVYGHNSKIHVKESDFVKRGQKIADMGDTEADQVKLYFEIRQQGKQVDPAKLLPVR